MITQFESILTLLLKKFNKGQFEKVDRLLQTVSDSERNLDPAALSCLLKFQRLLFVGQLFGLETLNSIFRTLNLPRPQNITYKNIHNQLTPSVFHRINEWVFQKNIEFEFEQLSKQTGSAWSKANVTVIADWTILKHLGNCLSGYQGYWFSGQTHSTVKGFKVLTVGIQIKDVFYPLYYDFAKTHPNVALETAKAACKKAISTATKWTLQSVKAQAKQAKQLPKESLTPKKSAKIVKFQAFVDELTQKAAEAREKATEARQNVALLKKEAIQAQTILDSQYQANLEQGIEMETTPSDPKLACKLLDKLGAFYKKIRQNAPQLPKKLHLSCDSGFNTVEIIQCCDLNAFILLSVPKSTERFTIHQTTQSLDQWIQKEYLEREKVDLDSQNREKKLPATQKPFVWRVKAQYHAKNRSVLLLFFRYNRSEKVTVIYCPESHSPKIFAKTMRRHWFARTQIEQFFRTIKHLLKIQASKTQNIIEITYKVGLFWGLALEAQLLTRWIRKKCPKLRKMGFKQLIKHITTHLDAFYEIGEVLKSV